MPLSPRTLRPSSSFTPKSISGLALWLDASATGDLYTTDAGPVTAVSSPTEISGCVGWWDASDAASITESGGLVSQWNDKSGQGNHATASGTARPTLTASGLNGRSVVTFDGTANSMSVAANAAFNTNDLTYFIVFKQAALANKGVYTKLNATAGTNGFGLTVRSDPQVWLLQKNANLAQVLTASVNPVTQARIYSVTSSSSAAGYLDGLSSASASSTADHSLNQAVRIGSREGSEFFNGYIAEVIHFNTALSTADRARVESYLASKWGISGVHRPVEQEIAAVASPAEIAGLSDWYDAADASTVTLSGGKITSWSSKVTGGRTLTQGSDSLRPVLTSSVQNGLPMAKFDGVDDFIRTATPEAFGDKTVFVVALPTDVTSNQAAWAASKQNITSYGYYYTAGFRQGGAAVVVRPETAGAYGRRSTTPANTALMTSLQFKTSELVAGSFASALSYRNGTLIDTSDSIILADYAIGSTMGANDSRPAAGVLSNFYSGYVGEVLVYDTYLSAVDRARVEKYLAAKWGIANVPDPTPPVGYWKDRSGNGRHATQATGASRPVVSTAALNGRSAASFDNSNDFLSLGNLGSAFPNSAATGLFVYRLSTTDQLYSIFSTRDNYSVTLANIPPTATYLGAWRGSRLNNIATNGLPTASGAVAMLGIESSADSYVVRNLGAALTSQGGDWNAGDKYYIGGEPFGGAYSAAQMCEAVAYNRLLNSSERQRIERYLAAKWGITLAPQVSNADAQDWVNRVYANGGTVTSSTAAAVNQFAESIAQAGLRPLMYRANLFAGTGLNAALVPLYRNYRLSSGRNEIQGEVFSGWTLSSATAASSAAAAPAAAPAGAPLASSFKEATTASATPHTMSVQYTATGAECVVSAYIKPDGRDWVLFSVEDAGGNPFAYAYYNLAGMATGSAFAGATNSTITDAGNGWARISFRCTPTAGTRFIRMFSSTANNANQTVGDATKGYLIWGFQLEYGTTLTAYDSRPLGNTTDTNVGPFVSGDYAETGASGGLTPNGVGTKRLDTGLTQTALGVDSCHLSVYEIAKPNAGAAYRVRIGSRGASAAHEHLLTNAVAEPIVYGCGANSSLRATASSYVESGAFWLGSNTTATSSSLFKNGLSAGTGSPATRTAQNIPYFVFALNDNGALGDAMITGRLGAYSIGLGMTSGQAAAYYTAMQAFQTALGRNA